MKKKKKLHTRWLVVISLASLIAAACEAFGTGTTNEEPPTTTNDGGGEGSASADGNVATVEGGGSLDIIDTGVVDVVESDVSPDGAACAGQGLSCSVDTPCCKTSPDRSLCSNGFCTLCSLPGETCKSPTQCCGVASLTFDCVSATCCSPVGQVCGLNAPCCFPAFCVPVAKGDNTGKGHCVVTQ